MIYYIYYDGTTWNSFMALFSASFTVCGFSDREGPLRSMPSHSCFRTKDQGSLPLKQTVPFRAILLNLCEEVFSPTPQVRP